MGWKFLRFLCGINDMCKYQDMCKYLAHSTCSVTSTVMGHISAEILVLILDDFLKSKFFWLSQIDFHGIAQWLRTKTWESDCGASSLGFTSHKLLNFGQMVYSMTQFLYKMRKSIVCTSQYYLENWVIIWKTPRIVWHMVSSSVVVVVIIIIWSTPSLRISHWLTFSLRSPI